MNDQFMLLPISLQNRQTALALQQCNDVTAKFGLQLTEPEIGQLIEHRKEALEKNGRIEFGGGVIQKMIMEFADSAYLYQENYAETLIELQECFYYFKNESMEILSDDELIKRMKMYFDDVCHGSIEYLQTTMLENYCRDIRYDTKEYEEMNGYEDNYIDFMDYEREDW
ncbi:MAG TPA: DUF6323 family protein [Mobilitalea sp.]|nr:DUF6323 family protein [Mobilitalea sp.]